MPQLFVISPLSTWNEPKAHPWSMALPPRPPQAIEARTYLRHLLAQKPDARIALLYQYDPASRDYLNATREVLGVEMERLVRATAAVRETGAELDRQIEALAASGAEALMLYNLSLPACIQAIRKVHAIGWKPARFLAGSCIRPEWLAKEAGSEAAEGLITLMALKTLVAGFEADPAVAAYRAFLKTHAPEMEESEFYPALAYTLSGALVAVLRQAGDRLTRESIMAEAANLKGLALPLLLPGITLNTSATEFRPLRDGYLARFESGRWVLFGDLQKGE